VLLSWSMARDVQELAPHEGLNSLVARIAAREIECECAGILVDLDTQADYETVARAAADCGDFETARSAAVF
jgi:CTP:molybdopterin cytidylyltransferase MocA